MTTGTVRRTSIVVVVVVVVETGVVLSSVRASLSSAAAVATAPLRTSVGVVVVRVNMTYSPKVSVAQISTTMVNGSATTSIELLFGARELCYSRRGGQHELKYHRRTVNMCALVWE